MNRLKISLFITLGIVVVGAVVIFYQQRTQQPSFAPFVRQAALTPTSEFGNPQATIAYYEEAVRKQPEVLSHRLGLAQVYLQHSKESAQEAHFLPQAEEALAYVLDRDPSNYHARVLQASLFNTLHQFEKGRAAAAALLVDAPQHAAAHGLLVDALVELGEYEAAVAACDRMLALRPGLPSYARASYLRELHGDTEGARAAMRLAVDAGVIGRTDRAWALYQLGQLYLGEDNLDEAELIFDGILHEKPQYAFALGGLGQVALLREELETAETLLTDAYALAPNPTFLEHLVEVYTLQENEDRLKATLETLEDSFKEADSFGENVRMEYADFLADQNRDLEQALRWAKAEYERRPGHLHALETYAWTLSRLGRATEAVPYIERAMRLGTEDAMVFYRAGMIYHKAGQADHARAYLHRAIEGNLRAESPTTAAEARTLLATLGA